MLQIFRDPKFDFMSRRNVWLLVSLAVVVLSVAFIVTKGVNYGVEFTGGTELQIKFAERPDIADIRASLDAAGFKNQQVSTIGDPDEFEVYIRLGAALDEEDELNLAGEVRDALRLHLYPSLGDQPDLNIADEANLGHLLAASPRLGDAEAARLASGILALRKELAIFSSWDEIAAIEGMTPEALQYLREKAVIGPLALRGQSYIGPAIGSELRRTTLLAVIGSLLGMLAYIWFRFQLQWGFAAVVALTHDTLITLGLFVLLGQEMSLPVVAAFLTLVGYSVNDTVVVFDRIRENLKTQRAEGLAPLVNRSINQTLSRTIITSGSTWIVVTCLYLFGGAALKPFSFVLTIGVLVGTYSSIFVASPILVNWQAYLARRKAAGERGGQKGSVGKAKKVRRTASN